MKYNINRGYSNPLEDEHSLKNIMKKCDNELNEYEQSLSNNSPYYGMNEIHNHSVGEIIVGKICDFIVNLI